MPIKKEVLSEEKAKKAEKTARRLARLAGMSYEAWMQMDRHERSLIRKAIEKKEQEDWRQKKEIARLRSSSARKPSKSAVVDHCGDEEVPTDKNFGKALQTVAESMSAYAVQQQGEKNADSPFDVLRLKKQFDKSERILFNKFDTLYRGHVYRFLLRSEDKGGCGFWKVRVGNEYIPVKKVSQGVDEVSGAEVFAAVWAKLFGVRYEMPRSGKKKAELKSYFLAFDFAQSNVGHGAFRLYLNMLTESVVSELTKRDMVTLKDIHGRIMHDARGKEIYVPKSDLDTEDVKKSEIAATHHFNEVELEKARKLRAKRKLELFYLAYYRLHADEKICPKWFRPYVEEMFERGQDRADVEERAIKTKAAPSRTAFYAELCRFRGKVRELADEMWDSVYGYNTVCDEKGVVKHVMDAKEALEREWDELALYVGYRRMHDIRYNIIRGLVEKEEMKALVEKGLL